MERVRGGIFSCASFDDGISAFIVAVLGESKMAIKQNIWHSA